MIKFISVLLIVFLCLGVFAGCGEKDVPDTPQEVGDSAPATKSLLAELTTKAAVFERIGEITYPLDYEMSQSGSTYKLKDGIYYTLNLNTKIVPPATTVETFADYVGGVAKVSLREYTKLFAEETTLDGCPAFYVESKGKDSNKNKYVIFCGVITPNGMTIMSAVINEEDWELKGLLCKEIMYTWRNAGMVDADEIAGTFEQQILNPRIEIPTGWILVKNENNTRIFKNPTGTIETTLYFGKQEGASLDRIVAANETVPWELTEEIVQEFPARRAVGLTVLPGETPVPISYDVLEITQGLNRCLLACVIMTSSVTAEEQAEYMRLLSTFQLTLHEEESSAIAEESSAVETPGLAGLGGLGGEAPSLDITTVIPATPEVPTVTESSPASEAPITSSETTNEISFD